MIKHLEKLGFIVISQKGSHKKLRNKDNNTIIVPTHKSQKTLKIGTYKKINKQLAKVGLKQLEF